MGQGPSKCDGGAALPPLPPPPAGEVPSMEEIISTKATPVPPPMEATTSAAEDRPPLRAPGQFERLQEDVKKLVNVNTFEGCKVDIAKPLSPMFAVSHAFWLGGSFYPNTNQHYKFGVTVGDNERVCIASMDQYGTLEGQLYGSVLASQVQGKLIFNLPQDPSGGFVSVADVDYNGASSNCQLKVAHNIHGQAGALVGASYMQAITSRFALGGEGSCNLAAPSATISAAAKFSGAKHSALATLTKSTAGDDALALNYHRAVSNRVHLGTELTIQPSTLDSQFASGAEFALKSSRVNLAVDGSGRMHSLVETALSPAAKLSFSGEVQFGGRDDETGKHRDQYKFGYALQIGQ